MLLKNNSNNNGNLKYKKWILQYSISILDNNNNFYNCIYYLY